MIQSRTNPPAASVPHANPFVPISDAWRLGIIAFVIFWKVLPPLITVAVHGGEGEYVLARVLADAATHLLMLIPFLVQRFGGTPIGWLHPLIFPILIMLVTRTLKSPETLLHPVSVWFFPVVENPQFPFERGWWPNSDVAWIHVKADLLVALSMISIYLGFILVRFPVPRLRWYPPRHLKPKMLLIVIPLFLLCAAIIQASGGIIAHMSAIAFGRTAAIGDIGHLVALVRFTPVLLAIWYVFDADVLRKPWFIVMLIAALAIQFLVSASRSATLTPLMLFLAIWIYHHRRIPMVGAVIVGTIGLLLLGTLGDIRRSGLRQVDFSILIERDLATMFEESLEEVEERSVQNGYHAIVAKVPGEVDLLCGRTYVAALAFFIPEAIWPSKPRGAGAHVGAMLYGRHSEPPDIYKGPGITPGPVGEAFWNFHVPGVIGIFVLFGAFRRWLAGLVLKNQDNPGLVAFYLFSVFSVMHPSSVVLTDYFRNTVLIAVLFYFLSVFRLRRFRGTEGPQGLSGYS